MNMFKKIIATLSLIAATITLSGCFPTGEKPLVEGASGDVGVGEKFEYSRENLTAEFTIPEQIPQATRISVKEKELDRDAAVKLFFGDRPYWQEFEPPVNGDIYYTNDGNYSLNLSAGLLGFSDETVCSFNFTVNYAGLINFCKPRSWDYNPPSSEELDDFPREAVINQARELFDFFDIHNLGEPEVYPMTVDAIKRVKEEQNTNYDIENLTKEHECYVLNFPVVFNGFEVANLPAVSGRAGYNTPVITLVYTRNGLVYLYSDVIFENEFEIMSEEPVKYGLEHALSEFKTLHDSAYLDGETLIYDFKAVYYPDKISDDGVYEFIPMWEFDGRTSQQEDGYISRDRYIAAVTSDRGILKTYKGV